MEERNFVSLYFLSASRGDNPVFEALNCFVPSVLYAMIGETPPPIVLLCLYGDLKCFCSLLAQLTERYCNVS